MDIDYSPGTICSVQHCSFDAEGRYFVGKELVINKVTKSGKVHIFSKQNPDKQYSFKKSEIVTLDELKSRYEKQVKSGQIDSFDILFENDNLTLRYSMKPTKPLEKLDYMVTFETP